MFKSIKTIILTIVIVSFASLSAWAKVNVGAVPPKTSSIANKVAAGCPTTQAQIDLDINQVRARILVGGDLWWDPVGQVPYYEVPIGSNKNSIFSGALWIGGYDQSDQLRVAAQTYRQGNGNDFWGGPISKSPSNALNISAETCEEFDKFWPITRADVENFIQTGTATKEIKSWPGNGDVSNGELPFLAPFFDADNDGVYNWENGDYPYFNLSNEYPQSSSGRPVCNDYLFGDKSIWWVFNDVGGNKTETNSSAIGLEVRSQAFSFNTGDAISYMTFYKYQIINRSNSTLDSTYFGVWCDPDLGYAADDYVGCDVGLGLGYCYNGDPDDESGGGYGINPPAVGIDFFQGPLADPFDGIDNNRNDTIDEPGEQISMSRFVFYKNDFSPVNGNPEVTDDYYQYLSGSWKNGQLVTFGGDGAGGGTGGTSNLCNYMFPGNTDPQFPGANWTMVTAGIQPDDMRWLQSAGTFTLKPGAVNYITTGVVWARGKSGPLSSVTQVKEADKIAQKLFDNCFQLINGPDAPDLAIQELDQSLIISFENTNDSTVLTYAEPDNIRIRDTIIVNGQPRFVTTDQKKFRFQGFKLYQLVNESVSASDVEDPSKAKLIAQVDLEDSVGILVNYFYDQVLDAYVPVQCTDLVNEGLKTNFIINRDLFSQGTLKNYQPYYFMAVSYAYNNYNPYNKDTVAFDDQQKTPYLQGRKNVKVYSGIPHKTFPGLVLNSSFGDGFVIKRIEGTGNGGNVLDLSPETEEEILNSTDHRSINPVYKKGKGPLKISVYDPVRVKGGQFKVRFSGSSPDSHYSLLDQNNNILDSNKLPLSTPIDFLYSPSKIAFGVYKIIGVGDVVPNPNPNNGFLEATQEFSNPSLNWLTGVKDVDTSPTSNWILAGSANGDYKSTGANAQFLDPDAVFENVLGGTWAPFRLVSRNYVGAPKFNNPPLDAISQFNSLASVDLVITNDKSKWTRSVVLELGEDSMPNLGGAKKFDKRNSPSVDKNGLSSPLPTWVTPDPLSDPSVNEDIVNFTLKSGTTNLLVNSSVLNSLSSTNTNFGSASGLAGSYSDWSTSTVTVPSLRSGFTYQFSIKADQDTLVDSIKFDNAFAIFIDYNRNGQFTDDDELVYSSAVLGNGPRTESGVFTLPTNIKNGITRMRVVCKQGDFVTSPTATFSFGEFEDYSINLVGSTAYPEDPNSVSSTGMGWFPGYAINVETGERLNIAFGENSSLQGENSQDMRWNPTSNAGTDVNGRLSQGGMHFIYIFNKNGSTLNDIPIYDASKRLDSLISIANSVAKRNVFKDCIWASLPLLSEGHQLLESDVRIRLRVAKDYKNFTSIGVPPVNGSAPLYEFEVPKSVEAEFGNKQAVETAMDLIRVVPNPYYAYSSYERTRKDQLDNRVRITNLPNKCTVSIYTINGTLVRQYKRDVPADVSTGQAVFEGQDFNLSTTLDWDLKNTAGVMVASGVYIFHIDAGAYGERIVKWFGVMRPVDLDSF